MGVGGAVWRTRRGSLYPVEGKFTRDVARGYCYARRFIYEMNLWRDINKKGTCDFRMSPGIIGYPTIDQRTIVTMRDVV
jgi:hypothetical protein